MSSKTRKIISMTLMILASLLLVYGALMKIAGSEQMVAGLSSAGLGNFIKLLGTVELLSVGLFLFPRTFKVGFLLITSYLGGALSIELASGKPPVAAVLLVVVWVSAYLRNKYLFINRETLPTPA